MARNPTLTWIVRIIVATMKIVLPKLAEARDNLSTRMPYPTTYCKVSSLAKLLALAPKLFVSKEIPIFGHSAEGGSLTVLSRGGIAERARIVLFGETGQTVIDVAYRDGEFAILIKQVEYARPLPEMPVVFRKIDTVRGYGCAGILIVDRKRPAQSSESKIIEFEQLIDWTFSELKSHGITWDRPQHNAISSSPAP